MNKEFISEARSDRKPCRPVMQFQHVGILTSVGRALKAFGSKVIEARQTQEAFEQLNAMTDHELEDVGITRADIPAVIAGTYRDARPEVSNVISFDPRCRLRSPDAHAPVSSPKKPSNA